ncbi:hypothetical protein LWI29_026328 [Acer saccharum]|uniref:Reverse transcriptase Ty1/copia-type domain-containing protein n=1 Tax=Acer saccharum TaxID=4024 RepID=A0AA39W330_ACESA|nr:hypothetical protein LWI29_026328 [Acer saccharum]
MMNEFEMTDMGLLHYFLGIEVKQTNEGIVISQQKYAKDLLKKFKMDKAVPCSTLMEVNLKLRIGDESEEVDATLYRSLVGNLMYLTATRPDLMFSVSMLSRFMTSPKKSHWEAGKRILRYVVGTINHGAVSWSSKKQPVVALSTTEAEYIALCAAGCQTLWLRWMLKELKCFQEEGTVLYCDNNSAIALSKNPVFHGRSKHIRIKYHYIRDLVKDGEVVVKHCKTQHQIADIFTKALKTETFVKLKEKLGVTQV